MTLELSSSSCAVYNIMYIERENEKGSVTEGNDRMERERERKRAIKRKEYGKRKVFKKQQCKNVQRGKNAILKKRNKRARAVQSGVTE